MFSFVLLGVGSGSTGISDMLSNFFSGSSSTGSSLSSLQKQTVDHPKSAAAWLALREQAAGRQPSTTRRRPRSRPTRR